MMEMALRVENKCIYPRNFRKKPVHDLRAHSLRVFLKIIKYLKNLYYQH